MGCCEKKWVAGADVTPSGALQKIDRDAEVSRRGVLKGVAALVASLAMRGVRAAPELKHVKLAFCSQLLCVIPYETTRSAGFFRDEGLEVELVYARGGNAAMQALVGGAVDYAATAFDVALQAYAHGANIRRFASTGRLPLFALVTAPHRAAEIVDLKKLEGHTVGVSALGNADHALVLYLLAKAGADSAKVQFATLGPNISEALRLGQIDAGMVQEPALDRAVKAGSRVLVNFMLLADSEKYLGGPYEFMGVAVRASEIEARKKEMAALARALQRGLQRVQSVPANELVAALPRALTAGADMNEFATIVDRYRHSLYPTQVAINVAACDRVAQSLKISGLLKSDVKAESILDLSVSGS
ncbi:MAG TPA: ABC transporter substrate-binding protein [Burkholderiales bacterium]|nr:ABC transporter substrate-binding protein [Burkholderiales bacterium]